MHGPLPALSVIPSTWYADDAVPNKNPFGKLSLLSPPVSSPPPSAPSSGPSSDAAARHSIPAMTIWEKQSSGHGNAFILNRKTQYPTESLTLQGRRPRYLIFIRRRPHKGVMSLLKWRTCPQTFQLHYCHTFISKFFRTG